MKSISFNAIISTITAKVDRSIGARFTTPELTQEERSLFFDLQNMNIQMTITPLDVTNVEEYRINKDLESKTPGQRLRGTLWRIWERNNEGYEVFDLYYKAKMEKLILHYQKMLDD